MSTRTADRNITLIPAERLYRSDDRLDFDTIIGRITAGKRQLRIHLIAESDRDGELYVIYRANELLLPIYDNSVLRIAGIARGRRSALKLLSDMIIDLELDKNINGNISTTT